MWALASLRSDAVGSAPFTTRVKEILDKPESVGFGLFVLWQKKKEEKKMGFMDTVKRWLEEELQKSRYKKRKAESDKTSHLSAFEKYKRKKMEENKKNGGK
ncbi:hypothetical protein AGMMS49959_04770 [Planctomycetales bacterium]|nr:hypothetical protein AGMMS49959_04770 [Planctomycetales bacterium]